MKPVVKDSSRSRSDLAHRYGVYGLGIASDTPLPLPRYADRCLCDVECRQAPALTFLKALQQTTADTRPSPWYRHAVTRDDSTYVGWPAIGEFLVTTDGRHIQCRRSDGCSAESFHVYLLGQALACALVRQGFEPLHATVVVVNGRAVAFLGEPAFGKSTLAACFVSSGHPLLTDDLLVFQQSAEVIVGYPGAPRIKLFPRTAARVLGTTAGGVAMNGATRKLILPLEERHSCPHPAPLTAIYALTAPRASQRGGSIKIEALCSRGAFLALLAAAFNRTITGRKRLERQLDIMGRLAEAVPLATLTFPRTLERLSDVRDAILEDLATRGSN